MQMCGLGRSAVYELAGEGKFPKPRKVTERATRWVESEVAEWIEALPKGTSSSPNPLCREKQKPRKRNRKRL